MQLHATKPTGNRLEDMLTKADPSRLCLIDYKANRKLTYGDVLKYSKAISTFLINRLGQCRGKRVGLILPNSWQYVVAMYGILMAGATVVPIDIRLKREEIRSLITDSEPSLIICDSSMEDEISAFNEISIYVDTENDKGLPTKNDLIDQGQLGSNDIAFIFYTGGTTGKPKGAMVTHRNVYSVLSGLNEFWHLRKYEEIFAQFLPMSHSGGLNCNLNISVYSSGATIIMKKFDPYTLAEAIERYKVTSFAGVPTIFISLLRSGSLDGKDISSLRLCFCSGASLPPRIAEDFRLKTGIIINVGWGLTECSPQVTVCPLGIYRPNYVGIPLPGTEVCAFDHAGQRLGLGESGELGVKGGQVMKGYWRNEEETRKVFTKDGYLLTGDIGYVDKDGVYFLGRKKNLINTGGYKVWPEEIENILLGHQSVKEVAVVGISDDYYGEVIKAFVVRSGEVSEEDLRNFCKKNLASYKVPKIFEFVNEIPKSSVGKVLHRALSSKDEDSK